MRAARKFILAVSNVLAAEVVVWLVNHLTDERKGK